MRLQGGQHQEAECQAEHERIHAGDHRQREDQRGGDDRRGGVSRPRGSHEPRIGADGGADGRRDDGRLAHGHGQGVIEQRVVDQAVAARIPQVVPELHAVAADQLQLVQVRGGVTAGRTEHE